MIYLDKFNFTSTNFEDRLLSSSAGLSKTDMSCYSNIYPFRILSTIGLHNIECSDLTILYGGNGSGKSTALNVIAEKMKLKRNALFNQSSWFKQYLEGCSFIQNGTWLDDEVSSDNSKIITSDDVFNHMIETRRENELLDRRRNLLIGNISKIKNGRALDNSSLSAKAQYASRHLNFETGENVQEYITMVNRRKRSYNESIIEELGREKDSYSNGETALLYFSRRIEENGLYLLDEPENSLSAEYQLKLMDFIKASIRCGCQFIIATHSPFLLSIEGAKIYDLSTAPSRVTYKWWELENMKLYYNFFDEHSTMFKK